jgi:hypothetical protein
MFTWLLFFADLLLCLATRKLTGNCVCAYVRVCSRLSDISKDEGEHVHRSSSAFHISIVQGTFFSRGSAWLHHSDEPDRSSTECLTSISYVSFTWRSIAHLWQSVKRFVHAFCNGVSDPPAGCRCGSVRCCLRNGGTSISLVSFVLLQHR